MDIATDEPAAMDDGYLVEAIIGFERMAGWAAARQSVLLVEFARRRPGDEAEAAQSDMAKRAGPIRRASADSYRCAVHPPPRKGQP